MDAYGNTPLAIAASRKHDDGGTKTHDSSLVHDIRALLSHLPASTLPTYPGALMKLLDPSRSELTTLEQLERLVEEQGR